MPWITHRTSPMDRNAKPGFVKTSSSLRAALREKWPDLQEFRNPTIVIVDGVPRLRKDWDAPVSRTATIEVVAVPAGVETLVTISIILTVASLLTTAYLVATMPSAPTLSANKSGEIPEPSAVFSFQGQRNQKRLNNVIERAYGKNRWWPAYITAPLVTYQNNQATMQILLSLGFGDFDVESVRLNDTLLEAIPGASWVYRAPGYAGTSEDPPDVVVYTEELENTELRGPNEPEYTVVGPYITTPAGTDIDRIDVNVAFPSGLYDLSGSTPVARTVNYTLTYAEVDSSGSPLGAGVDVPMSFTAGTTTPQRYTHPVSLPSLGRYSVSIVRTSDKNTTTSGQDRMVVQSVVSYARTLKTYDVATIAVTVVASDSVNTNAVENINVTATAKLPYLQGGVWQPAVATRNPVWAFLDVLRASYGAQFTDSDLDLAYFEELANAAGNTTFDYYFQTKTTLWEALRSIAGVLRGTPYFAGSDVRVAIDSPLQQSVALFTPENASGLRWRTSFAKRLDADAYDVAYVDPRTGLQDTVRFTPPGSLGVRPKKITFQGCTDRTVAWQRGAYEYLRERLQREAVDFTTGYEGYIPLYGDVITVAWPFPAWGTAGVVVSHNSGTLTVSEDCEVTGGDTFWITLRTGAGRPYGPVKVTQGANLRELVLSAPLTVSFDFTGEEGTPVFFTFGGSSTLSRNVRVVSSTPDPDSVRIEAVAYTPEVFAYDGLEAPASGQDILPYPVVDRSVPWIRVFEEDGAFLRVQWSPAQGAAGYEVSYAYDPAPGTTDLMRRPWDFAFSTTIADAFGNNTAYVPRDEGDLYIKVLTDTGITTYWRGRIAAYASGLSKQLALLLVNNCDTTFVANNSSSNVGSTTAQAAYGLTGTAQWDLATKKLVVYIDAPPSAEVSMSLTLERSSDVRELTAVSRDGGTFTFSADAIRALAAGMAGTSIPTVTVRATCGGDTLRIDVTPLVGFSAYPSIYAAPSHVTRENLDGLTTKVYGQTGPAVATELMQAYVITPTTSLAAADYALLTTETYYPSPAPGAFLYARARRATLGAETVYAPRCVHVCNGGLFYFAGDWIVAGMLQVDGSPGMGVATGTTETLFAAYDLRTGTRVTPDTMYAFSIPNYVPTYGVREFSVSDALKANTPAAPNTFTRANADVHAPYLATLGENLGFLAVELPRLPVFPTLFITLGFVKVMSMSILDHALNLEYVELKLYP